MARFRTKHVSALTSLPPTRHRCRRVGSDRKKRCPPLQTQRRALKVLELLRLWLEQNELRDIATFDQ